MGIERRLFRLGHRRRKRKRKSRISRSQNRLRGLIKLLPTKTQNFEPNCVAGTDERSFFVAFRIRLQRSDGDSGARPAAIRRSWKETRN